MTLLLESYIMANLGFMKKFYDVVFIVGDPNTIPTKKACYDKNDPNYEDCTAYYYREIRAHKCIIANRSNVFEAMFYGSGTKMEVETNSEGLQVVKIEDIDPATFQFMIDCMYNVQVTNFTITNDNIEKVAYAAEKYNFEDLRQKCDDYMTRELKIKNCLQLWSVAKKFNFKQVHDRALEMASPKADVAFSPSGSKYADLEMWKAVLSSPQFSYTNFPDVLNNAIYWATTYQNCDTVERVRDILKPLQTLLASHVANWKLGPVGCTCKCHSPYNKRSQSQYYGGYQVQNHDNENCYVTNPHSMYNVFFPGFRIPVSRLL